MRTGIKFLLVTTAFAMMAAGSLHEYYVSTTSIRWVPEKGEIQLTSRFFLDDLETLMQQENPTIVFSPDSDSQQIDRFIEKFYADNLSIFIDKTAQPIAFIGREYQDDLLVIYAQIDWVKPAFSSIKIKSSFLTTLFSNQQNIVHLITPTRKKSFLLKKKNPAVEFNMDKP